MHENTDPRRRVPNLSDLKTCKPECSYHYKPQPPAAATTMSSTARELQNTCKFKMPTQKSSSSTRKYGLNYTGEQQEGVAGLPLCLGPPPQLGVRFFPQPTEHPRGAAGSQGTTGMGNLAQDAQECRQITPWLRLETVVHNLSTTFMAEKQVLTPKISYLVTE